MTKKVFIRFILDRFCLVRIGLEFMYCFFIGSENQLVLHLAQACQISEVQPF